MLHKIKFQNNVTMCHYNRDQKKKKKNERSEPLIAVLEEVLKIQA